MTARIESVEQLDELPVGTIISRTENGLDVDVAVKTRSGRWKSVWYTHPVRPHEIGAWVGADIMARKASVVAELLASQNQRDAAEQRVQLVTERIGELEDVIDDAQNRRDAAEQNADSAWERVGELEDELDELRRELADSKQAAL